MRRLKFRLSHSLSILDSHLALNQLSSDALLWCYLMGTGMGQLDLCLYHARRPIRPFCTITKQLSS